MRINCFSLMGLGFMAATACFGQTVPADPLYQAKGDVKRQYTFTEAGPSEISKYRIYVPKSWTPEKKLPLVINLHGGASDPDYVFDGGSDKARFGGLLAATAEKHNFIVVAPTGYKGGWGADFKPMPNQSAAPGARAAAQPARAGVPPARAAAPAPRAPATPLSAEERARNNALSEKDTMNVIEMVAKEYNVDRSRMYLMGNSMGEIGTLHLAQKYPGMWCAIGPSDGAIDPASYPYDKAAKGLSGAIIVNGEKDTLSPVERNRQIAENFGKAGVDAKFLAVPEGEHSTAWYMAMGQIFDFFDQHTCKK